VLELIYKTFLGMKREMPLPNLTSALHRYPPLVSRRGSIAYQIESLTGNTICHEMLTHFKNRTAATSR
jgi:hypothetical protein